MGRKANSVQGFGGEEMTDIPADELKVEAWPPREVGGQHVTDMRSAIKVTHLPSGTEAIVSIGRSQHTNRAIAYEMIEAAITHPRFR
jgi:protein subunit release factor A